MKLGDFLVRKKPMLPLHKAKRLAVLGLVSCIKTSADMTSEVEFLEEVQTEVLRVFLLAIPGSC